MNRIDQLFRQKHEGILSLYFCAGHPALDSTVPTIQALEQRGIDMIEIGIPFSDPLADGPVIQDAATKALRNGMTLERLFQQLQDIRSSVQIPLLLMGYLNPVLRYGFEAFFARCSTCGIDGVILPDLPFDDYLREVKPVADRYGVHVIMLITPETSDERIRFIDRYCRGFIYMVSSAATTGAQHEFDAQKQAYFKRIASMGLSHPRMIGFGISNRQTLHSAQQYAAGAIVGSKFVQLLEQHSTPAAACDALLQALAE